MNGKGDKRRPSSVSKEQFEDNWDRIFRSDKSASNLDEFWEHVCKHDGKHFVGKGQPCNWCGEEES